MRCSLCSTIVIAKKTRPAGYGRTWSEHVSLLRTAVYGCFRLRCESWCAASDRCSIPFRLFPQLSVKFPVSRKSMCVELHGSRPLDGSFCLRVPLLFRECLYQVTFPVLLSIVLLPCRPHGRLVVWLILRVPPLFQFAVVFWCFVTVGGDGNHAGGVPAVAHPSANHRAAQPAAQVHLQPFRRCGHVYYCQQEHGACSNLRFFIVGQDSCVGM